MRKKGDFKNGNQKLTSLNTFAILKRKETEKISKNELLKY